jgi:hypothetical protein
MGLINKIINTVMGFKFNKVVTKNEVSNKENIVEETIKSQPEVVQQALFEPPSVHLTKNEVETLLGMVLQASFKGEHVQQVYELVLKLQTYYTKLP